MGDNLSTCLPSPATTSGPSSNHSASGLVVGSTVAVPQAIEQMTFTYVNITSLFLSAHDIWEQAEELACKGSGKNKGKETKNCIFYLQFMHRKLCATLR